MQYRNEQYGDNRRFLMKALREVGHRIEELVYGLGDHDLSERPPNEEWCIKEVVGFLRDAEREDLRAVNAMIRRDGARIEERHAQHGPNEHDYRSEQIEDLLWDFSTLREDTVWTLRGAGPGWEHVGEHPFRGTVTLARWVHEMNERDLEAMWRIERLREALDAKPAGGAYHRRGLMR
jgi:hypothetical protein